MRVTDLAKAIAPNMPLKTVGIRPGEKLHEVLCPAELSGNIIEFKDHYVIEPAFSFQDKIDYTTNVQKEKGTRVAAGFEYNSLNNPHFLDTKELHELLLARLIMARSFHPIQLPAYR